MASVCTGVETRACALWYQSSADVTPPRRGEEADVTTLDPAHWFLPADSVNRFPHYTGGNVAEPLIDGSAYMRDLAGRLEALGDGDEVQLMGWRVTPSQRLRPDLANTPTLIEQLRALIARGVRVRALLWRFPPSMLNLAVAHPGENVAFARELRAAGGQAVLDARLRRNTLSAHHQKAVVLRSGEDVVAYVGGIDLCRDRWDTPDHNGAPGRTREHFGAWHDAHCVVRGPAAAQVWSNFKERWNDPTPPTRFARRPPPIEETPPGGGEHGSQHVQVLRTLAPGVYPFAPQGEQSVRLAYERAIERAQHYVYIEDQHLWPSSLTDRLRDAAARGVKIILVLSRKYDLPGLTGVHNAMRRDVLGRIRAHAPHNVHAFHLRQTGNGPDIYLHSKVLIVDDRYAVIGSANVGRRSHTTDSELALAVVDAQTVASRMDGQAVRAARFARQLRCQLWSEHLGIREARLHDPIRALALWPEAGGRRQVHHAVAHQVPGPFHRAPGFITKLMNPETGPRKKAEGA